MHLFFGKRTESHENAQLLEEEVVHVSRVLRLKPGSQVGVIDQSGDLLQGEIIEISKKSVLVGIQKIIPDFGKVAYELHMYVAPTKNIDRFEWFLEKATEIGITSITPILTENSERKNIKIDRLNKIIGAAVKQSHKGKSPRLYDLIKFEDALNTVTHPAFIAHCAPQEKHPLKRELKDKKAAAIFIGPEGDFSSREIQLALDAGLSPISLGQHRLRTETAAIAAVHTASLMMQD